MCIFSASFKKRTSRALRKKGHTDKKLWTGGVEVLTAPCPSPAPEGLILTVLTQYSGHDILVIKYD